MTDPGQTPVKPRITAKGWLLIVAVTLAGTAFVVIDANNDPASPAPPAVSSDDEGAFNNDPSSRPGSAAVYARIETESNCVALQREFDIAMDNTDAREPGDPQRDISSSYADAAYNRAEEVGCYG